MKYIILIVIVIITGCSVTLDEINKPAHKRFSQELKNIARDGKLYEEDAIYRFNLLMQARKSMIDSLNILTYNHITIVDYSGTDGGGEVSLSYIFYGNTYSRSLIRGSSIRYLSKKDPMDDIMQHIYNFFNQKKDSKTMIIDGELPFGTYYVTTVRSHKIEYYEIYNNTVIKRR